MKRFITKAAGLFFLAGLQLSVSCSSGQQQGNTVGEKGTPVKVTHPVKADITEYLNLNATTIFLNKEVVRATFQGFIEQVFKNIGDPVKSGDRLFLIKTRESAATDSLRIDIGNEQFRGAVPVRAHTGGILTELDYHMGDYVSDGEQMAVVSDPLSLYINLNVPYQFVSQIEKGSRCDIILPDGRTLDATIQKIIPTVDPNSQTQRYLLRLDQKVSLPESLNVDARLPLKEADNAFCVNRNAVMSNETMTDFWVMKLINDTTAVRVAIHKGIENDSLVQVLKPGFGMDDRIIYSGAYGLPDTAKVKIAN